MSRHLSLLLVAALAAAPGAVLAADEIISATTSTTTGVPAPFDGYMFENAERQVTSFQTANSRYEIGSVADNVFVRRNNVNADQSSVWYTGSGNGTNLAGVHHSSYGPMLRTNDLLSGSDNTFANNHFEPQTVGNVERLDFTWNAGLTVNEALAFAVFERGNAGVHDAFAIAPILAIDEFGNPTEFGSLLKIEGGWGATNAIGDEDYRLFRYNTGDVIDVSTGSNDTGRQGIGGLLISAFEFDLAPGTQIFGYSLMSADVTATNSTELMDWYNDTYYPTSTDATNGSGGIDLASMNGVAFSAVPEPAALPALLLLAAAVGYCHCRRTRRACAS